MHQIYLHLVQLAKFLHLNQLQKVLVHTQERSEEPQITLKFSPEAAALAAELPFSEH